MTNAQVKTKAEDYGKQYYSDHQARTIAEDGYLAGYNDCKHLLQQTACYTALELLQQMLKELQKLNAAGYEDFKDLMKGSENERALQRVIRLIGERQANAV